MKMTLTRSNRQQLSQTAEAVGLSRIGNIPITQNGTELAIKFINQIETTADNEHELANNSAGILNFEGIRIAHYKGSRFWGVWLGNFLVAVTVYRCGAMSVALLVYELTQSRIQRSLKQPIASCESSLCYEEISDPKMDGIA
ncbi:MAG: hypothetical protein C5B47_01210 [Verrucomicrobia bacterium]|nr:MAG: hypothetical protein C5B47_01210 [Verrucomicrobiota bacterium]